ncbi:hypothetical protein PRIPAC_77246 [Pristionchus pacificus]|uniref:NAD(P)H-hydrate epimerase n=1 Tax=Pristionchus pacificus TaxID=54126 RepID=A0A2A6BID2_PRIPA|nr:hypothetical protein PRIPAC_77246 [Pristionchus pacificus]|eukprot:PDM65551.1 hypothetical protein PRIPAC_52493 [Pristionchus pacificus]
MYSGFASLLLSGTLKDIKDATLDIKKQGGKLATAAVNIEDRKRIIASLDKNPGQYDEPTFWLLPHEIAPMNDVEPNARDDDIVTLNRPDPLNSAGAPKQSLFYCRDCGASFIRYTNLLKHIERGKHFIRPEHIKLLDRVLGLFMRAIEDTLVTVPLSPVSEVVKAFKRKSDPELPQGWAIRHGRKVGRYPETTKTFVRAKFDEGLDDEESIEGLDDEESIEKLYQYTQVAAAQDQSLEETIEHEEEEMDDEHFEVEVEHSEEDIFLTKTSTTTTKLKKFFIDVHNPVYPNTPVPAGATEFD